MIEYLYDAIRATAASEFTVTANITDRNAVLITDSCHLMIYDTDKETLIATIDGEFDGKEDWNFTIPAEITKGLKGRYWYCICHHDDHLCFKQPLYLV